MDVMLPTTTLSYLLFIVLLYHIEALFSVLNVTCFNSSQYGVLIGHVAFQLRRAANTCMPFYLVLVYLGLPDFVSLSLIKYLVFGSPNTAGVVAITATETNQSLYLRVRLLLEQKCVVSIRRSAMVIDIVVHIVTDVKQHMWGIPVVIIRKMAYDQEEPGV